MLTDQNMPNPCEKNWLFYLVQPTQLLTDIPKMSLEAKLVLLKQFLSQAELADRKAFAASKADTSAPEMNALNDPRRINDTPGLDGVNAEPPYKKSKILDALALQIAAVLKFNLNLFHTMYEIPTRLLARLYRVLVTVTAKNSAVLQPLFEQQDGKDSLFKINPYAAFDWRTLHPTTIYAIFSYHVWCLQVSVASNMLPQPFRNLTPAVSGLTEIPDTVFFADNRVEISVVLERSSESVSQLTQIANLLDEITLARPFPTAFPLVGPGLPPALGAPLDVDLEESSDGTEPKPRQSILIRDAEPLSKEYLELSIKFILGRHAFQLQNFPKAEQLFTVTLNLMKQQEISYAEEVGATVPLVETYLQACKNSHPEILMELNLSDYCSNPCDFVDAFCKLLHCDWLEVSSSTPVPFWTQPIPNRRARSSPMRSPTRMKGDDACTEPTFEDHLYLVLMEDLHVEDNAQNSELIVPLGWSLRQRLEGLLSRALLTLGSSSSVRQPQAKQAKLNSQATVADSNDLFRTVQTLYTKVRVCNTIERLVSESFFDPVQFVNLVIAGPPRAVDSRGPSTINYSTPTLDPTCAYEFLFDCLDCFLHVLSTQPPKRSQLRVQLVNQFILYMVQQGLVLLGPSDGTVSTDSSELSMLKRRFRACLKVLMEHNLFMVLTSGVQNFVRSLLDMENSIECALRETAVQNVVIPGLPDPGIGIANHLPTEYGLASLTTGFSDSLKLGEVADGWSDLCVGTETGIFGSKNDVDMRSVASPFDSPSVYVPFAPHGFRPGPGHPIPAHPAPAPASLPPVPVSDSLGNDDSSALVHSATIRLLLTTCVPAGVKMCVRKLLGVMPATRILQLNSAWIPCLRRLSTLECVSSEGPISGVPPDDDPLTPFFTVDMNAAWLLIAAVQLAKASICLEHQTITANQIQALLTSALGELSANANSLCSGLPGLIWFEAALRHELLLLDLMRVLNPLAPPFEDIPSFPTATGGGGSGPKIPMHPFYLNDLSKRARSCLSHAAGLSVMSDRDMSAHMPLGLSSMLVCSAACFLLWNGEREFILPSSGRHQPFHSRLPKGLLPSRSCTLGALDLIRALLRLHEAVSTIAEHLDPSEASDKCNGAPGTVDGESRPVQTDRVKTAINNLWNLVVFGCLVPELTHNAHGSESSVTSSVGETKPTQNRSQIRLSTLVTVARMLACSCAHSFTSRDADTERLSGARKSSPALYLLSYLITCMSHITRIVCPEFNLPKLPSLKVVVDECMRVDTDSWNPTGSTHSPTTEPVAGTDTVKRKRSRWDPAPEDCSNTKPSTDGGSCLMDNTSAIGIVAACLLSDSRWPTDVPSNTKLPPDAMYDLLLVFLNSGLMCCPTRVDWLLLRAEVEFHLKRPHASLVTYLEACAVATDSFLRPLPSSIQCEEIVNRMVRICESLGLLGEAIVLTQLAPQGTLIEVGLQLIGSMLDLYISGPQATDTTGHPSSGGDAACGLESHGSVIGNNATGDSLPRPRTASSSLFAERPRGACGGFLAKTPWDCLDPLIDYLWDIRLLETLSSGAFNQGAMSVHGKFNAYLSSPEVNTNNREEIVKESVEARTLDFLRWMADQHF